MQDAELGKTSTKMLAYNAFYGRWPVAVNVLQKAALDVGKMRQQNLTRSVSIKIAGDCAKLKNNFAQSARQFFIKKLPLAVVIAIVPEQIGHDLRVFIASMVQARKPEARFHRFQ